MGVKRYYFQTEETVTTTRKGWLEIEEEFVQVYDCIIAVSPFLKNGASYQLLLWLGVNMNAMNTIHIGEKILDDFNKHLRSHCDECEISRSTFFRAVDELTKAKVLTKVARAFYYLNPHFFWKGTQKARIEFLQEEMKDGRTISYNPAERVPNADIDHPGGTDLI